MQRFVALCWNAANADQENLAAAVMRRIKSGEHNWRYMRQERGLFIVSDKSESGLGQVYAYPKSGATVLGVLFNKIDNRHYSSDRFRFDETEIDEVFRTTGRHFSHRFWGSYVALFNDPRGNRQLVMRDPSGATPCFIASGLGVTLMFSNFDDCFSLGVVSATPNWRHTAACLKFPLMRVRETGFQEIEEVLPGEAVVISRGALTHRNLHWSPAEYAADKSFDDIVEAERALVEAIAGCVGAWTGLYDSAIHKLSGGLDSSIVLGCMSRAQHKPEISCVNIYTDDVQADERFYAKLAANMNDLELIEVPARFNRAKSLESMLPQSPGPSVMMSGLETDIEEQFEKFAKDNGIKAVFSGQGGDHLFLRRRTDLIAADFAYLHGLRPGLLEVSLDVARMTRKSLWNVFKTVVRYGLRRRPYDPFDYFLEKLQPPDFLSDKAKALVSSDYYRHPWLDDAADLPPAKKLQILDLMDCQNLVLEPCSYADPIHPLVSQPIFEVCMQIPTYMLSAGGRERALVRRAVRSHVPLEILARTSKGAAMNHYKGILQDNRPFLQGLLLNGILVREGLIDKDALENNLSHDAIKAEKQLMHIYFTVAAEAWLRGWENKRPIPVAA